MVRMATFIAMTFGAFIFMQSVNRVHIWVALHQDEKSEKLEKEMAVKRMRKELVAQVKEKDSLA